MSSEYERKLIDMQYQMRENNAYLNDYIKDLDNWTEDMKKKEETVKKTAATTTTTAAKDLPPVRTFVEPPKPKKKSKKTSSSTGGKSGPIRSYDYRSWDKFDVEAECERVDQQEDNQDGDDENEDDAEAEEAWREEVLKQKAEHYKKWGNHHFEKKEYASAIEAYTKAIECNPTVAVYFANRAQCQLFEQRYGACEADCTLAIQLDGNYLKAYYRRALARIQLNKTEQAREDLEFVVSREPKNTDARNKLDELNRNDEIKRLGRVYPLKDKPVKQRSQQPLKRIEIQEIDTSVISTSETAKKGKVVIEEIESTSAPTPIATEPVVPAPAPPTSPAPVQEGKTQPAAAARPSKMTVVEKPISVPTSIPTSGFQFKRDWTSLSRQPEQQAAYFERIPPSSYKTVFSTGLDASVFSRILSLWSTKTSIDEQLINSMDELRRTPRFDTHLSFLDQNDKQVLKTLLQRLQTEREPTEKISTILNSYKVD